MKVAIEGCSHGELDKIYEAIEHVEKSKGFKVDLLLCCGDFQSVRNQADLDCMAVPNKYRLMNSFYKYYSGEKKAPVLTIFIGGNHEASNYLSELAYGGWVCPNIYYMGYAGVVQFAGLRIAGLSGIYKGPDYLKGHFEFLPYDGNTVRSAYHVRNVDVFRLKQMSGPVDIVMSHDWPRGVHNHGNLQQLLRFKRHLLEDVEYNRLGSRPAEELLQQLQPDYWFSAHLHVKYAAVIRHEKTESTSEHITKFLALDKCLPRRRFLQILDIPSKGNQPMALHYDPEWLCILRSTNHLLKVTPATTYMPGPGSAERFNFTPTQEEQREVEEIFKGDFVIPLDFIRTVVPYNPDTPIPMGSPVQLRHQLNPQTTAFCTRLGIHDPLALLVKPTGVATTPQRLSPGCLIPGPGEADITLVDVNSSQVSLNPDEISLSDVDDAEVGSDDEDDDDDTDENENNALTSTPSAALFEEKEVMSPPNFSFPEYKPRLKKDGTHSLDEDDTTDEAGQSPSSSGNKKFKRRNASLYESKDEDSEGN